jgi:hypothetical protein
MQVLTVIRKKHPITVLKTIVGLLDKSKCSKKFLDLNLTEAKYIYVKCDENGNIEYRGKKQEYRLYSPKDHQMVSFKNIPE